MVPHALAFSTLVGGSFAFDPMKQPAGAVIGSNPDESRNRNAV
jgi:hypothetical protein